MSSVAPALQHTVLYGALALAACTSTVLADELEVDEPLPHTALRVRAIPDVAVNEHGVPVDARIEMSRGRCYGPCPVYRVVLFADGGVHWHGDRHVEVRGDAVGRIEGETFAALWQRLRHEPFDELPAKYPVHPSPWCPTMLSDSQSVEVALTASGVDAKVADYLGCRGNARIEEFRALEERIDAVARTDVWVGVCRTGECRR
jgi:hypothetical protein